MWPHGSPDWQLPTFTSLKQKFILGRFWGYYGLIVKPGEQLRGDGETGKVWHEYEPGAGLPASPHRCSLKFGNISIKTGWGWRQCCLPDCSCHLLWLLLGTVLSLTSTGVGRLPRMLVTDQKSQLVLLSAVATTNSWYFQTKSLVNLYDGFIKPSSIYCAKLIDF